MNKKYTNYVLLLENSQMASFMSSFFSFSPHSFNSNNFVSTYTKAMPLFQNIVNVKDTSNQILSSLNDTYFLIVKNWKKILIGGIITSAIMIITYKLILKRQNILEVKLKQMFSFLEKQVDNITLNIQQSYILTYILKQDASLITKITPNNTYSTLKRILHKSVIEGKIDNATYTRILYMFKYMNKHEAYDYLHNLYTKMPDPNIYLKNMKAIQRNNWFKRLVFALLCLFIINSLFMILLILFNKHIQTFKKDDENNKDDENYNKDDSDKDIFVEQQQLSLSNKIINSIIKVIEYLHVDCKNFINYISKLKLSVLIVYLVGISFLSLFIVKRKSWGMNTKEMTKYLISRLTANDYVKVSILWVVLACGIFVIRMLIKHKEQ